MKHSDHADRTTHAATIRKMGHEPPAGGIVVDTRGDTTRVVCHACGARFTNSRLPAEFVYLWVDLHRDECDRR